MEASQNIQNLYLVSTIFEELENHFGVGDNKDLAELIINLADKYPVEDKFQEALKQRNGSDFSDQFSKYLLKLITRLKATLAPGIDSSTPEKPATKQSEQLPISRFKEDLLKAIGENQILIVAGETGAGKTTQITQYLTDAGYSSFGQVACSQPRCVSTIASASLVAKELDCRLGEEVGYSIRIDERISHQTKIKYISHSVLIRECIMDPDLKQYSVIVIDDVHERTVNADVLLGLMKQRCHRSDLKLVITSATTDSAEKLSKYFNSSPIFVIPGRSYPVEIFYAKEPEPNHLESAVTTVLQLHLAQKPGDIMVFLTSQDEVEQACQTLSERMGSIGPNIPALTIVPICSDLPFEIQSKIFETAPIGSRKVLLAGGIVETLISIDGIRYVVDSGLVKQRVYNATTAKDEVVVTSISKVIARQRAGRAGFKAPGNTFRLYTEAAHQNEFPESTVLEIQRANMTRTVLTLKALGINDWHKFDFIDAPIEANVVSAVQSLTTLGALDEEGFLTELGRKMALDP